MNESVDDVQRALDDDDDELGGPTVLSSAEELDAPTPMPRHAAPPQRATPMPAHAPVRQTPNPPTRPSTSIMTSAPVRPTPMPRPTPVPQRTTPPPMQPPMQPMMAPRQTPPYGAPVARGTPAMQMPSPFEESSSSMGYDDSFNQSFTEDDAATQLASAAYDDQVAQSLYAHTPRPGSVGHPQHQQHIPYEPPGAFEPPVRASVQRMSQPPPLASESPDMQARLARLQGLSLERPAVAASSPSSSSRGSSSKLPWVLLGLFVIGGGAYHFYTVGKSEKADKAVAATPTTPDKAGAGPIPPASSLLASGYVAAKAPITMSTTTSGRLKDVTVEAGDVITKGQLLASLDDGDIRAEMSLAGARVRDAKRQHQRIYTLVKAQAATPSDLEKAQGALEVASAEYGVAQQKLDKTRIKSPINGTVLEVLARPGESLSPGPSGAAAVLRIADLSALIAEVDVAEAELKSVYIGQETEVTSEAQRGHTYKGVVREIAEQADRARGTVLVKVDIVGEQTPPDDGSGTPPPAEGSAGSAAPPPAPEVKTPPTEVKAQKNSRRQNRNKKDPPKETPPAPEPPKETPKETPKPVPTGLRPGMAVQVRFIAKKTL